MAGRSREGLVGAGPEYILGMGSTGIAQFVQSAEQAVEKLKDMEGALRENEKRATATRTSLLFLSFGMLAAGGLMGQAARGLRKATDDLVQSFAAVEYRAVSVGVVLGVTGEQTKKLQQRMIELGQTSGFTALQAGEAMQELAQAGFTVEETMGAVDGTLKLAVMSFMSTSEAATLAVGVIRGFDLATGSAAETAGTMNAVIGELAQAANESVATAASLAEALKFVAATSDAAGISLEETLAVLMLASDNMIRAGIAGRALRMSLIRLQQVAGGTKVSMEDAAQTLQDLGVEFATAEGTIVPLATLVDQLNTAMEDMTVTERNATIAALFGTEALTLWSAVLREGGDAIREREMGLRAAAAKQAVFMRTNEDAAKVLIKWRKQVGESNVDTEDLTNQLIKMGYAGEEVDAIIDVITSDFEGMETAINKASIATEQVQQRLETLQGSILLLKGSMNALWVVFGEEIAPLMMEWNKAIKQLADWLSKLPGWLKQIIALSILFGFILTTVASKVLLTVGTLVMMSAAIVMLNRKLQTNLTTTDLMRAGMGALALQVRNTTKAMMGYAFSVGSVAIQVGGLIAEIYFLNEAYQRGDWVLGLVTTAMLLLNSATMIATISTWNLNRAQFAFSIGALRMWWVNKMLELQIWRLTHAEIINTYATWLWRAAWIALPLIAIAGVILGITNDLPFLAAAIVVATAVTWAWNAALWSNPAVAIIAVLAIFILTLIELARHWKEVTKLFGKGWDALFRSPDNIFDYMTYSADNLTGSLGGVTKALHTSNREWNKAIQLSDKIGGPRAPAAMTTQQKMVQVNNPRLSVNMGGVKIAGPMQEQQLQNVINLAADEAMTRWNQSFEAEAEEEKR